MKPIDRAVAVTPAVFAVVVFALGVGAVVMWQSPSVSRCSQWG